MKKLKLVPGMDDHEQRQVRLKDLENAADIRRQNIQLQHDRLKAIKAAKEGLEQGFLSAHKMHITKHSKKEKKAQKYFLMKEYFRSRVSIKREDHCFRIVIPKTNKVGKADMRNLDSKELAANYTSYKINIKDIIKLIREQEDISNTDYISKEKVAAYLKKNL